MIFNGIDVHLKPRLCYLLKWPDFNGYGFNLHAEKGKAGQYIGKVDEGSPAQAVCLLDGDRIVEVNGVNIGNENHQQVVGRIKAGGEETNILVVDTETDQYYKDEKKVVKGDLPEVVVFRCPMHDAEPEPEPEPEPVQAEEVPPSYNDVTESVPIMSQFRARLCHMKKRADFNGYGFNLHAERDKPGQFIGTIDDNSPAMHADLREGDRIIEVNSTNIESDSHQKVIELVKSGGDETTLLVVDKATDEYYKSQGIAVTSSMGDVNYKSSVREEQVTSFTDSPPVFHPPPPPSEVPPEDQDDFNVEDFQNFGIKDEAEQDTHVENTMEVTEVAEVAQVAKVAHTEPELAPEEDIFPPPPAEEWVKNDQQEYSGQLSAEVADTVEAVVAGAEVSAVTEETIHSNGEMNVSETIRYDESELVQNEVELAQNSEVEVTQASEAEVTQTAEAEVAAASDVHEAADEEIKENIVTEIMENAPPPQVEEISELTEETVDDAAVNGQAPEPVTTYTAPEPEPEPLPEPEPEPTPVIPTEPTPEPPKQANGSTDIFGGLSAKEMKERLKSRKKADPRMMQVGFGEKHKMFERL